MFFSAAIFANPQVRIYTDTGHLVPNPPTEKTTTPDVEEQKNHPINQDLHESTPLAPKLPLELQIKRIDAEILLLKAELSRKNGEPTHVKAYLDSLRAVDEGLLSASMKDRIKRLESYIQQSSSAVGTESPGGKDYAFNDARVVVLLPLTGDYGEIGQAIAHGLKEAFSDTKLKFYDTEVFDSMLELWNLVKLSDPTFVIGPLRPGKAQVLNDLDTQVPTLLLNEVQAPKSYVRSISLNRDKDVNPLIEQLVAHKLKGITLIVDSTKASQDMLSAFQLSWQKYTEDHPTEVKDFRINIQPLDKKMDTAVSHLVNASGSQVRKNWLQRTIKHKLHFDERSRHDLDAVVSLVSARYAIQVVPLLNFYHLGGVQHYWLPSVLPSIKNFKKSIGYWRNTYAFLPKYFSNSVAQAIQTGKLDESQVGIFHAFGLLAAKIVKSANDLSVQQLPSSLGRVMLNQRREPTLLPEEYWLNKGRISLIKLP